METPADTQGKKRAESHAEGRAGSRAEGRAGSHGERADTQVETRADTQGATRADTQGATRADTGGLTRADSRGATRAASQGRTRADDKLVSRAVARLASRPGSRTGSGGGVRAVTRGGAVRAATRADSTISLDDADVVAVELPPARVGIFEATPTHQARARDAARELGVDLVDGESLEAIRKSLFSSAPPDVLLVGIPGGEALIEAATALDRERPVIVAALAAPSADARERAAAVGADLFVLRPHGVDSLAPVLSAAATVASLRHRLVALEGTERLLRERLQGQGPAESTGFQQIDFFKRILPTELKRARRFGYPIALCLASIEASAGSGQKKVTAELRARVVTAIAGAVRDIDVPVELAEDRVLVFLPHSDGDAAETVGRQIAAAVRAAGPGLSVSIGIAAAKEGQPPSLARLMRDATAALRAAQLKGGNRVVVRR